MESAWSTWSLSVTEVMRIDEPVMSTIHVCAMGAFHLGTDRSWERNRDLRLDRVERGPTSSWS
jgi:hypothetical protein